MSKADTNKYRKVSRSGRRHGYRSVGDFGGWICVLLLLLAMWAYPVINKIQYNTFDARVQSGRYVAEGVILENVWTDEDTSRYKTKPYKYWHASFTWVAGTTEYHTDNYTVFAAPKSECDGYELNAGDTGTIFYDSEDPSKLVLNEYLYEGQDSSFIKLTIVFTGVFLVAFLAAIIRN